jgi:hypothetical protein
MENNENKHLNPGTSEQFMQVVPDSHFFGSLEMIENYLKLTPVIDREEILMAIQNTIKHGYVMVKKDRECENAKL